MRSGRFLSHPSRVDALSLRPWLVLCRAPGIGAAAVHKLLETFPDPAQALAASPATLAAAGLSQAQITALRQCDEAAVERDLEWLSRPGRALIHWQDPRFPETLRRIAQPPLALFVHGDADLLAMPQIAIVGARHASAQGIENARAFAAELAARGFVVTSGLALGIDGAAHLGALETGYTVAVCGTGLDRVYPARHQALAREIAQRGALISEYPLGVAALAENFPRRNRLISGLSMGVLVVEAARESGSLISARYALEQGREVFAIPGSIHNPMARGCHALIRQGAKLVETVDDIFEEIGPLLGTRHASQEAGGVDRAHAPAQQDPASAIEREVLDALSDAPVVFDQLAERVRCPVDELQAVLTALELDGRIAMTAAGGYQRLVRS